MSSNVTCNSTSAPHNNDTTSAPFVPFPDELKACLYILYSFIFLFGITGNSLACYVTVIKKRRQSSSDVFLVSLAVADLLASVFGPVHMIAGMVGHFKIWYFGEVGCHIIPSVTPFTLIASSWSLVLISLDRCRAISQPLSFESSMKIKIFGLMFIWGVAIAISVPYGLAFKMVSKFCWLVFTSHYKLPVWSGCILLIGWIIPLIIMTCSYSTMAYRLKVGEQNHVNNPEAFKHIKNENLRVVKMFITIVCAFFLFTTPYAVFYFTTSYLRYAKNYDVVSNHSVSVSHGLFVLTLANSCINPIIYARMHSKIREAIKTFFCGGSTDSDSHVQHLTPG